MFGSSLCLSGRVAERAFPPIWQNLCMLLFPFFHFCVLYWKLLWIAFDYFSLDWKKMIHVKSCIGLLRCWLRICVILSLTCSLSPYANHPTKLRKTTKGQKLSWHGYSSYGHILKISFLWERGRWNELCDM